jgi:hypothetical protein
VSVPFPSAATNTVATTFLASITSCDRIVDGGDRIVGRDRSSGNVIATVIVAALGNGNDTVDVAVNVSVIVAVDVDVSAICRGRGR